MKTYDLMLWQDSNLHLWTRGPSATNCTTQQTRVLKLYSQTIVVRTGIEPVEFGRPLYKQLNAVHAFTVTPPDCIFYDNIITPPINAAHNNTAYPISFKFLIILFLYYMLNIRNHSLKSKFIFYTCYRFYRLLRGKRW